MKKTILSALLVLAFTYSYAQTASGGLTSNVSHHEAYMLKSKNFNTTGWACVGGGSALVVAGLLTFPHNYDLFFESDSRDNQATFASVLIIAGTAAMITSIPMFVNSVVLRHKARLSLNPAPQSFNQIKRGNNVAALSLNISLGKQH